MIAIVPVERKEEVNLIFDCRASILEVSFGFEFVIHCLIFRFLIFNFDILTVFFHIIMVKKDRHQRSGMEPRSQPFPSR